MKEIERPDVDGASGEIDSRSGSRDSHAAIIILEAHASGDATRHWTASDRQPPGNDVPLELRSLAREFDLGGVILFSRNIEAPEQVAELAAEIEALGPQRCRPG